MAVHDAQRFVAMIVEEFRPLRISQFFENNLAADHRHADLLDKMMLEVEGVRRDVLRKTTSELLKELLHFRHFKRYYFQLDYDWDRLEFLMKKLEAALPAAREDLARFRGFLSELERP